MPLQTINIGANPNDRSGDPLRLAFTKVNSNFELLSTNVSSYQARASSVSKTGNTTYNIIWDTLDGNTITGFTYNSGVFTNTGAARKFAISLQVCISNTVSNITQCSLWIQKNALTVSNTARRAQIVQQNLLATSTVLTTNWTLSMATNDTITTWVHCMQDYTMGGSAFGLDNGYSTLVNITEIL
jgi:hypothetical protein